MSRIGKAPIVLPAGVTVSVDEANLVTVTGPKGTLTEQVTGNVQVTLVENEGKKEVLLVAGDNKAETNAKHGLYRALIANLVTGVSTGFTKSITINGVGYKCAVQGNKLTLNIGFSHPVVVEIPSDLTVTCPNATVGQFAADIKAIKKVEPYHGYGIYYTNEHVRRKEIKKTGKK